LLADLGHILEHSGVGADITLASLPLSDALSEHLQGDWSLPLASGDDYELCFTAPAGQGERLAALAAQQAVPVSRIGTISARPGLRCELPDGQPYEAALAGYEHFQKEVK
jgi:thiamine-monophosphate kinase